MNVLGKLKKHILGKSEKNKVRRKILFGKRMSELHMRVIIYMGPRNFNWGSVFRWVSVC